MLAASGRQYYGVEPALLSLISSSLTPSSLFLPQLLPFFIVSVRLLYRVILMVCAGRRSSTWFGQVIPGAPWGLGTVHEVFHCLGFPIRTCRLSGLVVERSS